MVYIQRMDERPRQINLSQLDLNLLVVLNALLQERSVTRAGQLLSLSQPATSAALARLRRMFDDQLLIRNGRNMTPTFLAENLRGPVREILDRIEGAVLFRPEFDPATSARSFSVYASDYLTIVLLQPVLQAIAYKAPGVGVNIVPTFSSLSQLLERDGVDLAFHAEASAGGFESVALFEDRFVCVTWRENTTIGEDLTTAQLETLPYLSFRQAGEPAIVDRELARLGLRMRTQATVESFLLGPLLLRGTALFTFVQEGLYRSLGEAVELRRVAVPVPLPLLKETMFWHPRSHGDPGHEWLRTQVLGQAAALQL